MKRIGDNRQSKIIDPVRPISMEIFREIRPYLRHEDRIDYRAVAEKFGMARVKVRHCILELLDAGLIERIQNGRYRMAKDAIA